MFELEPVKYDGKNAPGFPPSGSKDTPSEYKNYVGNYIFTPAKLSLDVLFTDGVMTTQEPLGKSKERITFTRAGDYWFDEKGEKERIIEKLNEFGLGLSS